MEKLKQGRYYITPPDRRAQELMVQALETLARARAEPPGLDRVHLWRDLEYLMTASRKAFERAVKKEHIR